MSNDFIEIGVVRAEGLSTHSQSIGCYVQIDGRLHDVITPLNADNQENEVQVPRTGVLRLMVKNMGCATEVLGSVSFNLKILPKDGFQWLPLFHTMSKDQIYELPEDVDKAKILILINPNKSESSQKKNIIEEKPIDFVPCNMQEIYYKEESKNCYGEDSGKIEKYYKTQIQNLTVENERLKKQAKNNCVLSEDLLKELKSSKALLVEERKNRTDLQEKISKIIEEYEGNLRKANGREDSLLKILEEKDQEISQKNLVISQLKTNIRNLEYEKQQIVDVVEDYKTELTLSNMTKLNQELGLVKGLLEESEQQRHKLQQYIQEFSDMPSYLTSYMSSISLGSSDIDIPEFFESRKSGLMNENVLTKNTNISAKAFKEFEIKNYKNNDVLDEISNSFEFFDDRVRSYKKNIEILKSADENQENSIGNSSLKHPESLVFSNKYIAAKSTFLQTSTPLRERNSNKRISKK